MENKDVQDQIIIKLQEENRLKSYRLAALEEQLREKENQLNTLVNHLPYGVMIHAEGRVLFANKFFSEQLGYAQGDLPGKNIFSFVRQDYHQRLRDRLMNLEKGNENDSWRIVAICADGNEKEVEIKSYPVEYLGKKAIQAVCVDVSGEKGTTAGVTSASDRMVRAIVDYGQHNIWTVNREFVITSFNEKFANSYQYVFGKRPEVGKTNLVGERQNKKDESGADFWKEKYSRVFEGLPMHFDYCLKPFGGGENTWREVFINPVFDEKGRVAELVCIGNDITEKKEQEEQLRESLAEKEILLREVHHRVKNNLQVISSILNLQASFITDKGSTELIKDLQNRIKTMAFIHESLYTNKAFSKIDFRDYVMNLSRSLGQSYRIGDKKINFETQVENIILDIDISIPCGLIINELLTNAFKYAFKAAGDDNRIVLTVVETSGILKIDVEDNGRGLPAGFSVEENGSLGLQLASILAEQVSGKLEIVSNNGTKASLKVPL